MKRDPYLDWLAEKRQVKAPADFAAAVMAATTPGIAVWKSAAFWARAAIFTLAVVGGIGRYAIAVFLVLIG